MEENNKTGQGENGNPEAGADIGNRIPRFVSRTDRKVVVFPAMSPAEISDGQIYFLFSIRQVEEIINEVSVQSVPFSPSYIEGVTLWRNHVVPVISLEELLGMETMPDKSGFRLLSTRLITVRILPPFSPVENPPLPVSAENPQHLSYAEKRKKEGRIMLRVAPTIRMVSLPIPCTPVSSVGWIPKRDLVRGVYEWEEGYLVVVHMFSIFS
ncbi:chemotaxis protein CheW [Desulfococcaceae bacterium HSG8]|nr:chemotaxis protein CheW [Desulfococcaceae bacterium HSG8]